MSQYNIVDVGNGTPVDRYRYPIFPGSKAGIVPNALWRPTEVNRNDYMERIRTKGWRYKRPNYRKGIDNDFSALVPQSNQNTFLQEKLAREAVANRHKTYRPLEKEVDFVSNADDGGLLHKRMEEVPFYGGGRGLKPPVMRNVTKFWSRVLKKPEDILRKTFMSGKNLSRSYHSNKYIAMVFGDVGGGYPRFRDAYQKSPLIPRKNDDTYATRNPFYHPRKRGYVSEGTEPQFVEVGKEHSSYTMDPNTEPMRGNDYPIQSVNDTTDVKDLGNHKSLHPDGPARLHGPYGKLAEPINMNMEKMRLPYDKYVVGGKRMRGGPVTLDRIHIGSSRVLDRPYSNREVQRRNTTNRIQHLPHALEQNINMQSRMRARRTMRDNIQNAPLM